MRAAEPPFILGARMAPAGAARADAWRSLAGAMTPLMTPLLGIHPVGPASSLHRASVSASRAMTAVRISCLDIVMA